MYDKDKANLKAILESCVKIQNFTEGFNDPDALYSDQRSFDAILMNFVVIGASASRLSETIKSKYDEIPWIDIKGFRNLVARDYFGVDAEEVWQIIHDHIPKLKSDVDGIIKLL